MEIKRLRCLALEIFETVNDLNPYYTKEIFSKTTNLRHGPLDINFNQNNTTKYGNNSLRSLGPHIWNSLPSEIKKEADYEEFKNYLNDYSRNHLYPIISNNSLFVLYFKTTKMLILGVCFILYYMND